MPKLNDYSPISVNCQHPPSNTQNKSPSAKTDYLLAMFSIGLVVKEETRMQCNLSQILPGKLHELTNFIVEEYLSKYRPR